LRESSESLLNLLIAGAEAAGALVVSVGIVTTPQVSKSHHINILGCPFAFDSPIKFYLSEQLHFCVRTFNMRVAAGVSISPSDAPKLLDEYYQSIGTAFASAMKLAAFVSLFFSSPS
jgi:hypothetical protein